jgi:uncharacterized protein (DUF1330 family)
MVRSERRAHQLAIGASVTDPNHPPTPAYAVAHLRDVRMGPDIERYLGAIDDTLAPYQGRFLIHGGRQEVLEGDGDGALIVIAFPDRERAAGWYHSAAYQRILPLRLRNAQNTAFLVDGVPTDHVATDVLVPATPDRRP